MFKFAILSTIALLTFSCSRQTYPESAVLRDFNLGSLVQQVHSDQLRGRTGAGSYSGSPLISRYRRTFDLYYQIDETGRPFDKTDFGNRLGMQIADAVRRSGASIDETPASNSGTSLTYSIEGHRGTVEVKGELVDGHFFKISGDIREEAFGDNR